MPKRCKTNVDALEVFNSRLKFAGGANAANHYPSNIVLVKNAQLSSAKLGQIESLKRVDRLKGNLVYYRNNEAEQEDDIDKMSSTQYRTNFKPQPQNEIYTLGTTSSRQRPHDVRIPLKEVFNFCRNNESLSLQTSGNLQLSMELNLDLLTADEQGFANIGSTKKFGTVEFSKMQDVNSKLAETSLTTQATFNDMVDSPFFVNQLLAVTTSEGGAQKVTNNCRITGVSKTTTNQLTLQLSQAWCDASGGNVLKSATTVAPHTPTEKSVSINKCELALALNSNGTKPQTIAPYSTFLTIEDVYPAAATSTRSYEIPPMVKNLYITFSNKVLSEETYLDSYRLFIDNVGVVNRPVEVGGPLHYDLINKAFMNNGEQIHNFDARAHDASDVPAGSVLKILMCPVPFKQVPQRLVVELTAKGGVLTGSHTIFFESVRQIK